MTKHNSNHNNNTHSNKNKNSPAALRVVLVHAEWCGICKNLMPHWEQFENDNNIKTNKNIQVIRIKDTEKHKVRELEKELNQPIQVSGYPTIFLVKGGKVEHFNGERTKGGLLSWVNKHGGGGVGMSGGRGDGKSRRRSLRRRKTIKKRR